LSRGIGTNPQVNPSLRQAKKAGLASHGQNLRRNLDAADTTNRRAGKSGGRNRPNAHDGANPRHRVNRRTRSDRLARPVRNLAENDPRAVINLDVPNPNAKRNVAPLSAKRIVPLNVHAHARMRLHSMMILVRALTNQSNPLVQNNQTPVGIVISQAVGGHPRQNGQSPTTSRAICLLMSLTMKSQTICSLRTIWIDKNRRPRRMSLKLTDRAAENAGVDEDAEDRPQKLLLVRLNTKLRTLTRPG
jgi:hypothetical protein